MAAGKKKKKAAANPARGFATTSIVSKPRLETAEAASSEVTDGSSKAATGVTTPDVTAPDSRPVPDSKELKDLSPEELEAQLEQSELQQLVETCGAKVRRDAQRQISRLETDRRLLRPQSEHISLRSWSNGAGVINASDFDDIDRTSGSNLESSHASEEVLLQRVWTLSEILQGMQTGQPQIESALQHILTLPHIEEDSASVWGLSEYLEFAAAQEGERFRYDATAGHNGSEHIQQSSGTGKATVPSSRPAVDLAQDPVQVEERIQKIFNNTSPRASRSVAKARPVTDEATSTSDLEPEVSDTDSDLDPDEMLAKHTAYRLRLFEVDPQLATSYSLSESKRMKNATRLIQRLRRIEADPLFDQDAAEIEWRQKNAEAFRKQNERRRLGINGSSNKAAKDNEKTAAATAAAQADDVANNILASMPDDDGLFEGIFDAPSEGTQSEMPAKLDSQVSGLVTRNLGKVTGVNPKRILEEACKARDSGSRVSLQQVSETTYHCRHAVLIRWSKDQEVASDSSITGIVYHHSPRATILEMESVATPSAEQSEAFACTAALFAVFYGSTKEEKASLRLPPAFRDLYQEFSTARQERRDAQDRNTVKSLRRLLDEAKAGRDAQEVVLTQAFTNRNRRTQKDEGYSGELVDLPEAKAANPELQAEWSRKTETPAYQKMFVGRQMLPMFQFKDQALDVVRQHQITILCGETGCGKSTQMPAYILEDELSRGRQCRIYCTEPRRISAISLAQRVSEELGEGKNAVGTTRSLVGYAIRLESQTVASTRLVYATVGIVLRMLESQDGLKDLTHLIVDEVHERSIDTDFLLIVLRTLLVQRPDLKVILMSATVDAQRFSQYLNNAPIINVPGRTFPVESLYLEDAIEMTGYENDDSNSRQNDDDSDEVDTDQQKGVTDKDALSRYSKSTIKTLLSFDEYRINYNLIVRLLDLVAKSPKMRPFSNAVLIFLPGIAEIRQLTDMLMGHPAFAHGWLIYPLHSTFSNEEQQAAFSVPPRGMRKIVLATNIAETGITIPDVTCVVDTGKHKEMRFDERRQLSRLIQSFITKANAKQRRGRAGRVQEGICFHLFTKHRHDKMMAEQQTPEMLRLSLQDLVMRVKICKLGDVEAALLQALDPPSAKNIRRAIDALVEVGALTAGEELTNLGQQIAKLPLDAQLGKLILLGSVFGCLDFALTIAATASSKSPFLSPMNARRQADTVRLGFKRGDSDLLTTYNAYLAWRKVCNSSGISEFEFCRKNFLSPANLSNIEELKGQLLTSLLDANIVTIPASDRASLSRLRHQSGRNGQKSFVPVPPAATANENNETLMSAVVAWSFYPKILRREGKGWRSVANNQSLSLHPTSVNKLSSTPSFEKTRYLSFYSIMQSSSRFTNAQEVTPVEPLALILLAGEVRFDFYAGVIIVDGNRLRFKLDNAGEMLVLQRVRLRLRETLAKEWKRPGRERTEVEKRWFGVVLGMFERYEEVRRAREGK